jgi:tetratricopeptide (TPR) repeat protein
MKNSMMVLGLLAVSACAVQKQPVQAPPTGEQLFARAHDYAYRGEDLAAEQYFATARAAGVAEERVVRELIKVCVSAGRLEHAIHHAQSYVERHPEDRAIRHALASIYFAKGDALSARAELEQLLRDWPEHAEAHFLLALILREQYADMAGAKRAFESYLALAPSGEHASEARAWIKRSASFPVRSGRRVQ